METPGNSRKLVRAITEIPYGIYHLPRSFEQKRRANPQEAQDFLTATRDVLPQENPYFKNQENPIIKGYLASGFYKSCWTFETSTGIWVLKIAHDKSPIQTKSHPSSEEYGQTYLASLNTQRLIFSAHLPNLIPEPQTVLRVKGQERATTIIVQPFIYTIMPFNKIKGLSLEDRQGLKDELETFLKLCGTMQKNHGISPEMLRAGGKNGHFVVAQKEDRPHLVMLDNDVFDDISPTPLFNFLNNLVAEHKLKRAIKKLR